MLKMVDKEIPYHTLSKYSETINLRQNDQSLVSTLNKKTHQFLIVTNLYQYCLRNFFQKDQVEKDLISQLQIC